MTWNDVELINVERIVRRYDGAVKLMRFPENVHKSFGTKANRYPLVAAEASTGCEIRFVGNDADIVVSAGNLGGYAEVYRGDFLYATEYINEGICKRLVLRIDNGVQKSDLSNTRKNYADNMWRVVFGGGIAAVIHDINPLSDIRPPHGDEAPRKTLCAYGTSITQGAGTPLQSNSYLSVAGRNLSINVLNKGMGGSCFCEKEVGEYLADIDWDVLLLEPMGNMLSESYSAEMFENRLEYIVKCCVNNGKPIVIMSSYRFLGSPGHSREAFRAYNQAIINICQKYKEQSLYFIDGSKIMNDYTYLCADLIHPSGYGHSMIGLRLADKLKNEFKII